MTGPNDSPPPPEDGEPPSPSPASPEGGGADASLGRDMEDNPSPAGGELPSQSSAPLEGAERPSLGQPPPLASGWQRIGAYAIDFILLLLVSLIIWGLLAFTIFNKEFDNAWATKDFAFFQDPFNKFGLTLTVSAAMLSLIYFGVQESMSGQTLGKRALNIKVVRFDGSDLTPREALVRNLLRLLWRIPHGVSLISLIIDIGLMFLIIDIVLVFVGDRRRIGDKIAGTQVVRLSSLASAGSAYGAQPYRGAAPGPAAVAPGPLSRVSVWRPREAPPHDETPEGEASDD